jgi:hypothetical protein
MLPASSPTVAEDMYLKALEDENTKLKKMLADIKDN